MRRGRMALSAETGHALVQMAGKLLDASDRLSVQQLAPSLGVFRPHDSNQASPSRTSLTARPFSASLVSRVCQPRGNPWDRAPRHDRSRDPRRTKG
jgi:hypothetical protein